MIIVSFVLRVIKGGDIISFVEDYFNLSFKEAMQKLNEDFNLGLVYNQKINYQKIKEIELEKKHKQEEEEEKLYKAFNSLCTSKLAIERQIKFISSNINLNNIDDLMVLRFQLEDTLNQINLKLENIEKKMAVI